MRETSVGRMPSETKILHLSTYKVKILNQIQKRNKNPRKKVLKHKN